MNRRTTAPFSICSLGERAATFGLAAVVSLGLLAGMDGVADRQYETAHVAQPTSDTMQVADAIANDVAAALLHESV